MNPVALSSPLRYVYFPRSRIKSGFPPFHCSNIDAYELLRNLFHCYDMLFVFYFLPVSCYFTVSSGFLFLQCYDKYLMQNLQKAAKLRGHSLWARAPDNAGYYNSKPHETGFFCEKGDYDSYYGRFFLRWYTQVLIDHADNVLSLACLAFEDIQIVVKVLVHIPKLSFLLLVSSCLYIWRKINGFLV